MRHPHALTVYIAASWKHQHAVEMLTGLIETQGHQVLSFVREACETEGRGNLKYEDLDAWIESEGGRKKFEFDLGSAIGSDVVVYLGPSGCDAWAEVGAAFGAGVPVVGLWSKGEPVGLARRMMQHWFRDHEALLAFLEGFWKGLRGEE